MGRVEELWQPFLSRSPSRRGEGQGPVGPERSFFTHTSGRGGIPLISVSAVRQTLAKHPVIPAIREKKNLLRLPKGAPRCVFLLESSLLDIAKTAAEVSRAGHLTFIHVDLVEGLKVDRTPSPPWAFRSLGASRGGIYFMSFAHGAETPDASLKPAVFSTGPGVRHTFCHFLTECLATAMLIFGIFVIFSRNTSRSLIRP